MHVTSSVCPTSVLTRLPDATPHTFRVSSSEAVRSRRSSHQEKNGNY
jgi:hypothetical protein